VTRQFRLRRYLGVVGWLGVLISALVATGTGAGAEEDFVTGSGRARASLFEILPRTGGLSIPVNLGRALTTYQGTAASASSTAVTPPSTAPSESPSQPVADCGGTSPAPPGPGPAPQSESGGKAPGTEFPFVSTLEVTSDDEGAAAGRQADLAATPPGSPVQGALQHQEVVASRDPLARASTTSSRLAFAGLAELTGGEAEARTGVVEGRTRLAEAVVTVDRLVLVGGLVVLDNLRWEAVQRTGAGETADGSFTIGRASVSGRALPAPAATGAGDPLAAVNQALVPIGLALDPPRFERSDGVARVSPLSLRLADSALGRQVAGPLVGALQPVRDPLVQGLLGVSCDFGLVVTVADVAAGILTGSGGVSFDIGGVSATTEGVRYDNPLAGPIDNGFADWAPEMPAPEVPGARTGPAIAAADAGLLPAEESAGLPIPVDDPGRGRPSSGPRPSQAAAGVDPGGSAAQPASIGPTSSRLPGRRGGAALVVGLIGLAGIAVLGAADGLHLRRAARSMP
jgi:hypothetical protein